MKDLSTQEIGSFRKPVYLSSKFRSLDSNDFLAIAEKATSETITLFERSGLDNIGVGGEMFRWEMYEHPASRINGIRNYGPVRSFDNRYYNKGSVVGEVSRKKSFHREEVDFLRKTGRRNIKVPLTGPYTLMDWSFNEHYGSREDLALAFGRLLNEEIRELKGLWGGHPLQVQIDEPAATTHPNEMGIVKDSVNRAVKGIEGIETHIHVCYSSDYSLLFNIVPDLDVSVYNLEFANRDGLSPRGKRAGYADVKKFAETAAITTRKVELGLGVTDVHIDTVEPEALIESRIRYALKFLGPDRIRLNPDCGLRTRSRDIGFEKLKMMDEARDRVAETL